MSRDFNVTLQGQDITVAPKNDRAAAWLQQNAAERMRGFDRAILDRATYEDLRDMALCNGLIL